MSEPDKAGKLNNVISKLGAVSDFIKRIGDDSFLEEGADACPLQGAASSISDMILGLIDDIGA
jgi:hypothetical protein